MHKGEMHNLYKQLSIDKFQLVKPSVELRN